MSTELTPVIVGIVLTAALATLGTATNTLFNVYADTQVIRAEMKNAAQVLTKHERRISNVEERVTKLETVYGSD